MTRADGIRLTNQATQAPPEFLIHLEVYHILWFKPSMGSPLLEDKAQSPWPTSPPPPLWELPRCWSACVSSRLERGLAVTGSSLLSGFEVLAGGIPSVLFNCWFTSHIVR